MINQQLNQDIETLFKAHNAHECKLMGPEYKPSKVFKAEFVRLSSVDRGKTTITYANVNRLVEMKYSFM